MTKMWSLYALAASVSWWATSHIYHPQPS